MTTELRPTAAVAPTDEAPQPLNLVVAIAVAEELQAVLASTLDLLAGVEQVTGLRRGQLKILHAVGPHGGDLDEIADRLGEHPEATRATAASLVQAGLLTANWPGGPTPVLHRTEAGRTTLDRLAALPLEHACGSTADQHHAPRAALTLVRAITADSPPAHGTAARSTA